MAQNAQKKNESANCRKSLQRLFVAVIIIILLLIGGCMVNKTLNRPVVEPEPVQPGTEEPVPKDSQHKHYYKAENHAPTCIEEGYTFHLCSCGDNYKDNIQPALGHMMIKGAVITPTQENYGYTVYTCSRCGVTEKRDFASKLESAGTRIMAPEYPKPLTPEELERIQLEIDRKVELYMINISMACNPEFESGTVAGWLKIANSPQNKYPQVVKIVRDDTGELIYTSSVIPVGYRIDTDTLDVELPAGDYECTAYFNAIDPQTGVEVGCVGAKIIVTIKS